MAALNFLSLTTAPFETFTGTGAPLGRATSFFYKRDDDWLFLVTNWHVVSGRDPANPRSSPTGAVPTRARLTLHKRIDGVAIRRSQKVTRKIDLNNESGEGPKWLEHPNHRSKIDVVVLKIANDEEFKKQVACHFISEAGKEALDPSYEERVTDDVFVIGYPWGLTGGDRVLPLYKRGSIASEPIVNPTKFLIDCRTSKSMSGSPVICSHSGLWSPSGTMDDQSIIGTVQKFVGVYSGRLYERDALGERQGEPAQLEAISEIGIVWRSQMIEEIIAGDAPGTKLSELLA